MGSKINANPGFINSHFPSAYSPVNWSDCCRGKIQTLIVDGEKKESTGSSLVLTPESCFSHVFLSKIIFVFLRFDILTTMLAIKKFLCVQQKKAKIITYWHLYPRLRPRKCSFCMVETDAVVVHPGTISGSWYKLTNLNLLILTRQNSTFLLQKELT